MIDLTPVQATVLMLGLLLLTLATGFPLAFAVGFVGLVVGLLAIGPQSFNLIYIQIFSKIHGYTLLSSPMFVYMGYMLQRSGIAEKMYDAVYLFLGSVRGGLAATTIVVGAVLAACVGVIGASVTMLTIVALPAMVQRGYSKSLAAGTVCASGTLGILIPPSIMLVVYGPMANLSVGKLFMAAFIPGFLLAGLYIVYVGIRCLVQPAAGPAAPIEERSAAPILLRLWAVVKAAVPPALIILAVLGVIYFGIAPPTEAAAIGAFATTILAIAYRRFDLASLKDALSGTLRVASMILLIVAMSVAYTSVFLWLGGGDVVAGYITAAPGGRWGAFALIMIIIVILGMFLEWMGVVFVMVPILGPTVTALGFDPLWFAMMIVICLQTGFLSPPFATAIFYLRGAVDPSLGVSTMDVIRGVYPFIGVVLLVIFLCVVFPQIVLWLPSTM